MLNIKDLSFWEKALYFESLDFTIIGAGIVGLSTAIFLKGKFPRSKILFLERGYLPSGASTKNAGFACFGSISELLADLKTHSENEVFSLVEKRWKGLEKLRKSIGDKNLDFHKWGGFELFDNIEKYNEYIKLVTMCLYILNNYASKECANSVTIYFLFCSPLTYL